MKMQFSPLRSPAHTHRYTTYQFWTLINQMSFLKVKKNMGKDILMGETSIWWFFGCKQNKVIFTNNNLLEGHCWCPASEEETANQALRQIVTRTVNLDKMITFSRLCFLIWRLGDKYSADFMKLLWGSNESLFLKCLEQWLALSRSSIKVIS